MHGPFWCILWTLERMLEGKYAILVREKPIKKKNTYCHELTALKESFWVDVLVYFLGNKKQKMDIQMSINKLNHFLSVGLSEKNSVCL